MVHVFTADTDPGEIQRAIDAGEHFWLDVPRSAFDPLLAGHDPHLIAVFPGAAAVDDHIEEVSVGIYTIGPGMATVRDQPCPQLDELRRARRKVDPLLVMAALAQSLTDVAGGVQGQIDDAETGLFGKRSRRSLEQIRGQRQNLSALLRISRAQRALMLRRRDDLAALSVPRAERRVRTLEGDVSIARDVTESARQTAAEAFNLSLSITADKLTTVATVFLPLTVVTGFFGMNFRWMVDNVDSFAAFLALGVGGPVLVVLGVWLYVRRAVER